MSKNKKHRRPPAKKADVKSATKGAYSFVIPDYVIGLAWFLPAISVAAFFYYLSVKNSHGMLWSVACTLMLLTIAVSLSLDNSITRKEIASRTPIFFGYLEPSNEDPLPPTTPPGVVSLMLGGDLQVLTRSTKQRVLISKGVPFLTIGSNNGKIWISAAITDSQNQTVVRIIKNEFQAFPERAFNPLQPDSHSLLVRDSDGAQVLRLRFLNPRRIMVYGRFALPDSRIVVIDDDGLHIFPGGGGIGHLTLDMTASPNAGVIAFQ